MLCREISALISILQGRMVVFFNGQQPFPSYLLQGKIVGAGGGGGICLDHSCFLAPVYCLASHFGLLSNLPGQITSMQGAQVQNKIQSRDTET